MYCQRHNNVPFIDILKCLFTALCSAFNHYTQLSANNMLTKSSCMFTRTARHIADD